MLKYYGTKNFICWLTKTDNEYLVSFGQTRNLSAYIDEFVNDDSFIATKDADFKIQASFKPKDKTLFYGIVVNSPAEFSTICKVLEVIYG